jgi:hypothetical protein
MELGKRAAAIPTNVKQRSSQPVLPVASSTHDHIMIYVASCIHGCHSVRIQLVNIGEGIPGVVLLHIFEFCYTVDSQESFQEQEDISRFLVYILLLCSLVLQ